MKLRNKKTGEVGTPIVGYQELYVDTENGYTYHYESLQDMCEEWEDFKESKEYWSIECDGEINIYDDDGSDFDKDCKEIGNYFKTKEEAEKAVEKLKAWKRLKDKGYKLGMDLSGVYGTTMVYGIKISASKYNEVDDETRADLDLFFGGGE